MHLLPRVACCACSPGDSELHVSNPEVGETAEKSALACELVWELLAFEENESVSLSLLECGKGSSSNSETRSEDRRTKRNEVVSEHSCGLLVTRKRFKQEPALSSASGRGTRTVVYYVDD